MLCGVAAQEQEEVHDSPRDWVNRHIKEFVDSDGQSRGARRRLLLTTRGRRSGLLRRTALYFWRDGDRLFVVGSDGGSTHHPAWYLNLTAEPHVTVELGGETFPAVATDVPAADRDRLWAMVVAHISSYESFKERTERQIPLVYLHRV